MSSNIKQFSIGLKDFAEREVPEAVRDVRDAVGLEALGGVVRMTPVRSGRARGNWSVTNDAGASSADVNKFDKSGAITITEGAAVIQATRDPFMPLWIHNAIAYISVLNDGTATRTAHHMVEATVARIRRVFSR